MKYLSKVPPVLVTDNYSFVLDGDSVAVKEILSSQEATEWWKSTSKSVKYYCSDETLKTFYPVCLHNSPLTSEFAADQQ